jgi:hemolysin III
MHQYTLQEELANSLTHGAGALLSATGLAVLVVLAAHSGTAWHVVSFSIYGATLVLLYTASTLYHSFRNPQVKHVLRIIDHSSIYLLIAGSYTPFTLVTLRGVWGWSLFGAIWGIALLGILFQSFSRHRFKRAAVLLYVLMGWLVLVAIKPLVSHLPVEGMRGLVAGGCLYTFGIVFYVWKRLPYHHAVWHLMVLAGSACHYFTIMFFVLPAR